MSLFDVEEPKKEHKEVIPVIHEPAYRSSEMDLRYTSKERIVTHVSGYPWVVQYYSQVVGRDDPLTGRSTATSAVHQQYRLLRNFELKVSGALSISQDSATKELTGTGTANVYPCLVPNTGDQFIADIGNGRLGLFSVITTRTLSHFKKPVHEIEYQLLGYLTEGEQGDLDRKTVKTLHFRREYLDYNQNPLIEDEDHGWVHEFEIRYSQILKQYFHEFTTKEYMTFIVPEQAGTTYDPFLTRQLFTFFSSYTKREFSHIRMLNVEEETNMLAKSFWDLVNDRNVRLLDKIFTRVGLTSARSFSTNVYSHSIRYSGITNVVYPKNYSKQIDVELTSSTKVTTSEIISKERSALEDAGEEMGVLTPMIHPVTIDDYYVLSKAFYEQSEGQSILEQEVWRYVSGGGVNTPMILALIKDYESWGELETFYYTPLLLILIDSALRSL